MTKGKRKSQLTLPFFTLLGLLFLSYILFMLFRALSKVLVESNNRLDALVEVVEAVVLVGRVDGVFAETEAHEDGLDAQHPLKLRDDRDAAA